MANGSRHSMYLVPEASYGVTPPTAPEFGFYRHNSTTLAAVKNTLDSAELNPKRQRLGVRSGTSQAAGNVVSELSAKSFDRILEALMMGTWTNNVLKVGSTRRSFSILRIFEDMEGAAPNNKNHHLFTGMEANSLQLAVNTSSMLLATVGWVGKKVSISATPPAGAKLGLPETTEQMDSFTGTITEAGKAIGVITEISINLENGIEPRYVVGSRDSIKPSSGMCNITGQISAYFEDSYLYEKFLNEQTSNISFELKDPAGNTYKIDLPNIKYTAGNADTSGAGSIMLVLPFTASYDPASNTTMTITRTYVGE
ncbi:hypothetical protein [Providencia phage Kokobel2]|nr:hypothetical protein [Providencia phage Kokobel2]